MIAWLLFFLTGVTQAVFLTLKLTGAISWGWLWVTSPAWIYCGFVSLVCVVVILLGGALAIIATSALSK